MILAARIVSMLFTPFYLPIVGLIALFLFSYLSIFPLAYKLQVLIMTYLFTILLPTVMIHLYRRYQGWNLIEYLGFNPVWWLCLVFFVAGLLGTCRMILRQHSLAQVVAGFWVGFICAAIAILFI